MCGRRLLLAAITIMKRLLTFMIFIQTCVAIIANLFVQRQMTGDLYRYNHGKLTECWINKTFVSRNSSSIDCSKFDEISGKLTSLNLYFGDTNLFQLKPEMTYLFISKLAIEALEQGVNNARLYC